MSEMSTSEARVEALLYAGLLDAYNIRPEPVQECCSCGALSDYGCTVPLADGSEPFACSVCNANPACWPDGDDGLFSPLNTKEVPS